MKKISAIFVSILIVIFCMLYLLSGCPPQTLLAVMESDADSLGIAIYQYELIEKYLPETDVGLNALITADNTFSEHLTPDPWGGNYNYALISNFPYSFIIWSDSATESLGYKVVFLYEKSEGRYVATKFTSSKYQ